MPRMILSSIKWDYKRKRKMPGSTRLSEIELFVPLERDDLMDLVRLPDIEMVIPERRVPLPLEVE